MPEKKKKKQGMMAGRTEHTEGVYQGLMLRSSIDMYSDPYQHIIRSTRYALHAY